MDTVTTLWLAVGTGFAGAALMPLLKRALWRDTVAVATAIISFLLVVSLFAQGAIASGARASLPFSPGLPALALQADFGLLFALIATALWVPASLYAVGYLRANRDAHPSRFHAFFCLSVASAVGVALAANLLTFVIFFEALTLATWPLVAHRATPEARAAGRRYLAYTLSAGACLLAATAWAWRLAGSLEFSADQPLLTAANTEPALPWIFALFLIGVGVKAALLPLHPWLPAAMVAPTPVSALLHAVAVVKAGAFGVLRLTLSVFDRAALQDAGLSRILAWLAVATIIYGSLVALRSDNLKARLAYSTVSHLSYIVLGAAIGTPAAIAGALLHLGAHAFLKIVLFMAAGAISTRTGRTQVSELDGLGRRMPWTFGAFAVASIGLIGLPPSIGFVSKLALLQGAVPAGWPLAGALLLSGLLNAAYLAPVVHRAFFRPDPKPDHLRPAGALQVAPLVAVAGLGLVLGLVALFPGAVL